LFSFICFGKRRNRVFQGIQSVREGFKHRNKKKVQNKKDVQINCNKNRNRGNEMIIYENFKQKPIPPLGENKD